MKDLFVKVKAHSITRTVLRYLLGVVFITLGIILAKLYGNIWLFIAIILCMLESVILIAFSIRKSSNRQNLIKNTLKETMPSFNLVSNNREISKAYAIFDLNKIAHSFEPGITMLGEIGGVVVSVASIKCKLNGCGIDDYFIRLYAFVSNNPLDIKLSDLHHKYLLNYRYEIIGNTLYLITIAKGGRGRLLSMNPVYFKTYEQWVLRQNDEDIFIRQMVDFIGGNIK